MTTSSRQLLTVLALRSQRTSALSFVLPSLLSSDLSLRLSPISVGTCVDDTLRKVSSTHVPTLIGDSLNDKSELSREGRTNDKADVLCDRSARTVSNWRLLVVIRTVAGPASGAREDRVAFRSQQVRGPRSWAIQVSCFGQTHL